MTRRLTIALLVAPLWAPLLAALYAAFFWPAPGFMGDVDPTSWIGMAAAIGALSGYGAVLALGLPAYKLLRKRNRRSLPAYSATWFALALVAWLIVFVAGFARQGLNFSLSYLAETIVHRSYVPLSFGIIWAVVGATFWAIVRPDRNPMLTETSS
jgi:hypothetical protein